VPNEVINRAVVCDVAVLCRFLSTLHGMARPLVKAGGDGR
jgi:hypothetical protein